LLVDFGGPLSQRLQAQVTLIVAGAVLICIATVASAGPWLAASAMTAVGFGVLFAGVVSSTLAGAATSLLLAFILPVSMPAPVSALPGRLAGWGLAGVASLIAIAALWPAPARDHLRAAAIGACRAIAGRLRAEIAFLLADGDQQLAADRDVAAARAEEAAESLQRTFLATPYRPNGLRTSMRMITRLVAELGWLSLVPTKSARRRAAVVVSRPAIAVKAAAAGVLERGAELLAVTGDSGSDLQASLTELSAAMTRLEDHTAAELPARPAVAGVPPAADGAEDRARPPGSATGAVTGHVHHASMLVSALDPAFRAQEIGFAVSLIGRTIRLTAAAERRSWLQRILGRQPGGLPGTLPAAEERAAAHVESHSIWLRNSIRGAAGLGLAVLVARLIGVQHSFWVVLGTLAVLRSNALSTGQDSLRALAGTVAGLLVGSGLLAVIGTNATALWAVLPIAVLLTGVAPTAISFAAGQAAFTLTLVILFNLIQPAGWRVGLLRLEDIALGCAVSVVVGLLFWPRGASSALRKALSDAYSDSAAYLVSAVKFGTLRCSGQGPAPGVPVAQASRAAAADRLLDDVYRSYLAERGHKTVPLADVARLVSAVGGIRLEAGAVLDLWRRDQTQATADRSAACGEIMRSLTRVRSWYDDLASSLVSGQQPHDPLTYDEAADARLTEAVRLDLDSGDRDAAAMAVRLVWTGDHLDAARRLQAAIVPAARVASDRQRASRFAVASALGLAGRNWWCRMGGRAAR
jgi:uncharacterized membrane protein YccC